MAAPTRSPTTFINLNTEQSQAQLNFQDFSFDSADKTGPPPEYQYEDQNVPESSQLLEGEEPEKKAGPSFWEFAYYQQFFNVNTDQVLHRIMWSMIPLPGRATYLHRCIKPSPDLYGPFWICATLVFTIAIGGNLSDYLHAAGQEKLQWKYDFHKVSLAATAIYSYAFLIPLALFSFFWYRQSQANYTLLDLICLYGYSLSIYVPISILCVIQIWWLQWSLVIAGSVLSACVLILTLWPAVKDDQNKLASISLVLVLFFHFLMAFGFLVYFFAPSKNQELVDVTTAIHPSKANFLTSLSPINGTHSA